MLLHLFNEQIRLASSQQSTNLTQTTSAVIYPPSLAMCNSFQSRMWNNLGIQQREPSGNYQHIGIIDRIESRAIAKSDALIGNLHKEYPNTHVEVRTIDSEYQLTRRTTLTLSRHKPSGLLTRTSSSWLTVQPCPILYSCARSFPLGAVSSLLLQRYVLGAVATVQCEPGLVLRWKQNKIWF